MTAEELHDFLEWSIPEYAQDWVRAGRWKTEEALERSREEHTQLLPQGVETPDQYLRTVWDEARGERVGEVWYGVQRQEGWDQLFVYWIGIRPEHRRRGYATEVFRQVEDEARRMGLARVGLHVFAENTHAVALYERLGYMPKNVIMAKDLRLPSPAERSGAG